VPESLTSSAKLLICFTTSGNSKNGLRAVEEANKRDVQSICFLGCNGGFTKGQATMDILVPGSSTARFQEAHKFLFHVPCEMVEEKIPKA
jgi:D-sedoheptulose 7-phosphate isomerase